MINVSCMKVIIMTMKICVVCGREFKKKGKNITCDKKCAKERKKQMEKKYKPDYYIKNWTKWQKYRKDAPREKIGTGDLLEKNC